jgi:hypothetical protein
MWREVLRILMAFDHRIQQSTGNLAGAERERVRTVLTLDRADFSIYLPARTTRSVIVPEG